MKKIVFSDIDGTLLTSEHKLSKNTLFAINKLQEKNIDFVIISARSPSGIYPILLKNNFSCPIISYSGALILDKDKNVLYHKGMNKEVSSDTTSYENLIMGEPAPTPAEDTIIASIKDAPPPPPPAPTPDDVLEGDICEEPPVVVGFVAPDISNTSLSASDTLEVAPVMPEFPGGQQALIQFLGKKIKYPTVAQGEMGPQGRVIIRFVVDKEGNVVNPKVVRSVDPYLDKEALRIINQMPKWKPGELEDGTKVAVYFTVPVMFRAQ